MKSRQGIPKESSVFVSFVSDTSLGQREFSTSILSIFLMFPLLGYKYIIAY